MSGGGGWLTSCMRPTSQLWPCAPGSFASHRSHLSPPCCSQWRLAWTLVRRWAQCSSTSRWGCRAPRLAWSSYWQIMAAVNALSSMGSVAGRNMTTETSASMLRCSPCGQRSRRSPVTLLTGGGSTTWMLQLWKMQRTLAMACAMNVRVAAASAGGEALLAATAPGQHITAVWMQLTAS